MLRKPIYVHDFCLTTNTVCVIWGFHFYGNFDFRLLCYQVYIGWHPFGGKYSFYLQDRSINKIILHFRTLWSSSVKLFFCVRYGKHTGVRLCVWYKDYCMTHTLLFYQFADIVTPTHIFILSLLNGWWPWITPARTTVRSDLTQCNDKTGSLYQRLSNVSVSHINKY